MYMKRKPGARFSDSWHALALCLGFGLAATTEAQAGGLSIWPVHVNLSPDQAVQELQISNPSREATYVQVMAVEWHAPEDINSASPVDAILAVPPVFELDPEGSQLVRLAARGPIQDGAEQSYRLVITEVPRTAGLVPNSLAIAARMTLPVFVTPDGAAPAPVWTLQGRDAEQSELVLTNQGEAHIEIRTVEVFPAEEDKPTFESDKGGLILAGKDMSWPLDIDLTELKGPVTVKAQTNIGPIETLISLPGG